MDRFLKHMAMQLKTRHLQILIIAGLFALPLHAQDNCIDPQQIDEAVNCPSEYQPVCGCDGEEYYNACVAEYEHGLTSWTEGSCAEACEAGFMFSQYAADTFYLFNTSTNYDSLAWSFNGEAVSGGTEGSAWLAIMPADTTEVCLSVWNEAGCSDTFCLHVYEDSPDAMCNNTDCIYPGDANGDRLANIYDLSNIGYGFGLTGPERELFPDPSNPILWAPNFGEDWETSINNVDFKHADCDGNGVIDEADVAAIQENYLPAFETANPPTPGAPPVYLQFDTTEIVVSESSPDFINFSAGVYIGTDDLPVEDLHSMAFHILYPYSLTVTHSITAQYNEDAFFGPPEELLEVQQDLADYEIGRYDLAWSRRNSNGEDGDGRVATMNFIISSDIIMGRSEPETSFDILVDGVVLIDSNRDTIAHDLTHNSVLTIYDESTTSQQEVDPSNQPFKLFPNPATDELYLELPNRFQKGLLEIRDTQGRKVLQQQLDGPLRNGLNISGFTPGLYWVSIWADGQQLSRKLLVK